MMFAFDADNYRWLLASVFEGRRDREQANLNYLYFISVLHLLLLLLCFVLFVRIHMAVRYEAPGRLWPDARVCSRQSREEMINGKHGARPLRPHRIAVEPFSA